MLPAFTGTFDTAGLSLLRQIYERLQLSSSNSLQGKEMSLPMAAAIVGPAPCFIDIQIYLQAIIKLGA